MRAPPRQSPAPWAVVRIEWSPGNARLARLRSPTRKPAVSAALWRYLADLAAIYRHRQTGRPDFAVPEAADTLPPGVADTAPPGPPRPAADQVRRPEK